MHWQSTQVTVGAMNSRQRAPWPHRAQGGTGLHWSLLCQRSSKNLQPGHLPAVFTTLSSKLKESEVKGSREENVLNVNLKTVCWDSAPEMGFKSQSRGQVPLDLGDSLKRWEERSRESWALRLRHWGPRRPLFTQATMLPAFIAGMQLVSDTKWLYRTFQTLLLGQSLQP